MKILRVNGQELKLKISPSFLENAKCPLNLKLHYVDRVGEQFLRVPALRGSAAHDAIAHLIKVCTDRRCQPEHLGIDEIRSAVEYYTPHSIVSEISDIFSWVRLWANRYRISRHLYGWEERVALDEDFEEVEWNEASYRGILDVIDIINSSNTCIVTDWKSQPHILSQTDLDAHEQMTHYCWLAWKLYPGIETFKARIWYLRYGFYAETTRTIEDLEAYDEYVAMRERKILEIEDWNPIPGKHCGYCDYIHMCPKGREDPLEGAEIITFEQALIAAQELTVAEPRLKNLKDRLREYVKNNDEVRLQNDWVYGYEHKVGKKYDPEKAEEVLGAYNRSLSEIANIDVRKADKLIKEAAREDPGLAMDLADVAEEKHRTEFKGYLRKGGE